MRNPSATAIEVLDVSVFDSLGTRLRPLGTRKQLVKASKQSARRYRDSGLKVKAGAGGTGLIVAGATATGAVGAAYVVASAYAGSMGGGAASLTAAGAGLLVAGPAVLVVGLFAPSTTIRSTTASGNSRRRCRLASPATRSSD